MSKCTCHERDSSYTCDFCKKEYGEYGHMEYNPYEIRFHNKEYPYIIITSIEDGYVLHHDDLYKERTFPENCTWMRKIYETDLLRFSSESADKHVEILNKKGIGCMKVLAKKISFDKEARELKYE